MKDLEDGARWLFLLIRLIDSTHYQILCQVNNIMSMYFTLYSYYPCTHHLVKSTRYKRRYAAYRTTERNTSTSKQRQIK